jgi:hypothetical protein
MHVAHRILAVGALVLALSTWEATALADPADIPTDLPLRDIRSVDRDWQPDRCTSETPPVICTLDAFLACLNFYRRDLCELAGFYPSRISRHEHDLYFDIDHFEPLASVVQYRLLEYGSLDARYEPPLLLVHLERRNCYRGPPLPPCGAWWPRYAIISHLYTTAPEIAAWGYVEDFP